MERFVRAGCGVLCSFQALTHRTYPGATCRPNIQAWNTQTIPGKGMHLSWD